MRTEMLPANAVLAANRTADYIRETPLEYSAFFSELTGARVWLKLENLQRTGSFKLRGAVNKLLTLSEEQREVGCVAASSGNHGAAVATAMAQLKVDGVIFVPETASTAKVEAIRRAGGDVRLFGTDGLDTEQHARQYAADNNMTYLSPYNDADVVAGQGSCGVEIARQISSIDAIFVAVGGGGLISGVGSFLKSVHPGLQVVGCQPENSAVMAASAKAGEILDMASSATLSDGTAGGIEAGSITFAICQAIVDQYVLVSEDEIAVAMREFIDAHSMLLEGAAAVPLAALKKCAGEFVDRDVVVIICGGNISRETLKKGHLAAMADDRFAGRNRGTPETSANADLNRYRASAMMAGYNSLVKKTMRLQTVLPVAVALLLAFGANAQAQTTAIVNVNIIPMSSQAVLQGKTVLVTDGRITTIGNVGEVHIPEDILLVDGTDRYLIPGLSEMHGHVPGRNAESLQRILRLYVANGVTLVRGMLGQPSHLELREQLLAQEILGPRLYTSGPSFNGRSVSSPGQAREMVREQHAAGYDFLKIHPGLSRDEFDAIAQTANEVGIPFAGHVPADVGVERALRAGIATIDHLDGYMQTLIPANEDPTGGVGGFFGVALAGLADEDRILPIAEATRTAGTWNVPTQTLFEHVVSHVSAEDMLKWPEMRYMPDATLQQWAASKAEVVNDDVYDPEIAARAIELRRLMIKALHDAGAELLLGSDSPQIFNVPGFVIHRELQLLVDAGLSPYEALRTGTVAPARFFGREHDAGTIEVGKVAELVLLDANPLQDISATRRVHGVMLRGRCIAKLEIRRMLAELEN